MKVCCICKLSKDPLLDFNKNKGRADGLQNFCKECGRKKSKKHYENNKQTYLDNNADRKLQHAQFVYDYLKEHPCVDCGEKDPIVLEFDHVRGIKVANVSTMINTLRSLDAIKSEINKCEIRCSNCHKRKTAKQFGWYKNLVK
jgi:hypothetical protein